MKIEAEYSAIKVDEPIEAYFNSARYAKTFKKIMVSSRENQEESTRSFSRSLSPTQRLEYMNFLNRAFISGFDELSKRPLKRTIAIKSS
ncbi:MAG: hypothetical protein R2820_15440 [Cyclobacteriaceae bacterium]